jgi:hypothetical protein
VQRRGVADVRDRRPACARRWRHSPRITISSR